MRPHTRKNLGLWLVIGITVVFFLFPPERAGAAAAKDPIIVVEPGQTLRQISKTYLGDANLWGEILRVNGLSSPGDVKPGLKMRIPVTAISGAMRVLDLAVVDIQAATSEGARLFAPHLLDQAVKQHRLALTDKRNGRWDNCREVAQKASVSARQALEETRSKRNVSTRAVLRNSRGTVQSRKTSDLLWGRIEDQDSLIEREKVRTLSRSAGDILFVDESRIRLSENSQVVIQAMRVDRLSQRKKVDVSLDTGDVFALTRRSGPKKTLSVKLPGVTTDADSTNFWMSRSAKGSKIANYDESNMKVTSQGVTVVLGKNKGTLVKKGRAPSAAIDLLSAPTLLSPSADTGFYDTVVDFAWQPVAGAVSYHLEIANSAAFDQIVLERLQLKDTRIRIEALKFGSYFWRLAAVDALGFPGAKSRPGRFWIKADPAPPQLVITTPEEGQIYRQSSLKVTGVAKKKGQLFINEAEVTLAEDGSFRHPVELHEGLNTIQLVISDSAGNTTRRQRVVTYMPDKAAVIEYDPGLVSEGPRNFVTRDDFLLLSALTTPNARVTVLSGPKAKPVTSSKTDASGRFHLKIAATSIRQQLNLQIQAPSGFVTTERFSVTRDTKPPKISLDRRLPAVTSQAVLRVKGQVTGSRQLLLNHQPVSIENGRFDARLNLRSGRNRVELTAVDAVGNQTRRTKTILRDSEPPRLVAAKLSKTRLRGGETVEITVRARDATAMKQVVGIRITVAGKPRTVNLTLDKTTGRYRGIVKIPPRVKGKIALREVTLEDYVGNKQRYSL